MCSADSKFGKFIKRFLKITKALLSRFIFALFSFISVWRVTEALNNQLYWLLMLLLLPLSIETIYVIYNLSGKNQKKQLKWITPNVFFYLICSVPCIWLLELKLLNDRLTGENNKSIITIEDEILETNQTISINIADFINIDATDADWTLALEQILIFALVLAKWIAPKDGVTNEQLSQLLLVNIAAGADILELMETFDEEKVKTNSQIVYLIMGVWTWSLLQFVVVLTAYKQLPNLDDDVQEIVVLKDTHTHKTKSTSIDAKSKGKERKSLEQSNHLHNKVTFTQQKDSHLHNKKFVSDVDELPMELQKISDVKANGQRNNKLENYESAKINHKTAEAGNDGGKAQSTDIENNTKSFTTDKQVINNKDNVKKESCQNSKKNNEVKAIAEIRAESQMGATNHEFHENDLGETRNTSSTNIGGPECFCFYNEIWAIVLSILFQDGPFFVIRMIILVYYHVMTHMNLFFTAKNIFVIILLLNRIRVITKSERTSWLEHMQKARIEEQQRKIREEEQLYITKTKKSRIHRFPHSRRSVWRSMVR